MAYSTKPRVGELIRECVAGWIGVPHDAVRAESYVIFFFVFFPCSYPTFESTTAHHSHGDCNFHVTVSFFDANILRIGHRRSHIPIPDSYRVRTVFILYRVQDWPGYVVPEILISPAFPWPLSWYSFLLPLLCTLSCCIYMLSWQTRLWTICYNFFSLFFFFFLLFLGT